MEHAAPGLRILMIDDSLEDIFFVQRALEKSGLGQSFHSVPDGQEAIRYLLGEGRYADRQAFPFPNLLLCDLKMPGLDGFDLLRWMHAHPDYAVIPTVIFTSSAIESDLREAYQLGANAYIVKPSDFSTLVNLIRETYKFWSRCECPPPPPGAKGS